jgi:hypothetical protein
LNVPKTVSMLGVDKKNRFFFFFGSYGYDGSNPMFTCGSFYKKKKKLCYLLYIWLMHVEKFIDLNSHIKSWSLYKFIILGSQKKFSNQRH